MTCERAVSFVRPLRAICLFAVLCGLILPTRAVQAQGDTKEHSYIGTNDGTRVYDTPLMKLLATNLNNQAKYLHVVISSCYSGGFATQATALQGSYDVAVTRSQNNVQEMATIQKDNGNTYEGETGYATGTGNFNTFGWDAQWSKKLSATPASTAQQLFDAATANEFDKANQKGGFPTLVKGGAETQPVSAAQGKCAALIWDNFDSNFFYNTYVTLQNSGYYDGTKQNGAIQSAFQSSSSSNFGGTTAVNGADPPCYVDYKATGDNLKTMVTNLATQLKADAGNMTGFVYVGGHGNTAKAKADTLPNAAFGAVGQGANMTSGSSTSITLDTAFTNKLLEGVTQFTPDLRRVLPAAIDLSTYAETYAGQVAVTLDGLTVGSMFLNGSPTGGVYSVNIPDSVLLQLENGHAFDTQAAVIGFNLPNGTPSNVGFQLATEWDMNAGLSDFYGVSLAAPSVMIPTPGSAGLLALAVMAVARRRRPLATVS